MVRAILRPREKLPPNLFEGLLQKPEQKQKRKLLPGLLPKVLQNPARERHAKLPRDLPGSLRLHHPEIIEPKNRGPMVENSAT